MPHSVVQPVYNRFGYLGLYRPTVAAGAEVMRCKNVGDSRRHHCVHYAIYLEILYYLI